MCEIWPQALVDKSNIKWQQLGTRLVVVFLEDGDNKQGPVREVIEAVARKELGLIH